MPRQNRVTPFGELIATPARGILMGNRGCLHDAEGRIRRHHVGKRWIYCLLEFKGRRRQVMAPGRYTELFFLDEATALAAGHRPCMECQRDRYLEFRRCWMAARGLRGRAVSADELDHALHAERLGSKGQASGVGWDRLPDGVIVGDEERHAYLVHGGRLLPWTPGAYGAPQRGEREGLRVVTPRSIVAAIRQGLTVQVHPSTSGGLDRPPGRGMS